MFNFVIYVKILEIVEKSSIYYARIKERLPFKYLQSLRRMVPDS